jgi:hypothetical protein
MHIDQVGARLDTSPLRVLGLIATLLTGCYSYRPLPDAAPMTGRRVAVALTDDGTRTLAGLIGPGAGVLEGDVLRADSTALLVAVAEVETRRGERSHWNGERVQIPHQFVRAVQERRLSVGGTGILGGAVAFGLYAAYELFLGPGEGGGSGTGSGGGR